MRPETFTNVSDAQARAEQFNAESRALWQLANHPENAAAEIRNLRTALSRAERDKEELQLRIDAAEHHQDRKITDLVQQRDALRRALQWVFDYGDTQSWGIRRWTHVAELLEEIPTPPASADKGAT